MPLGFCYRPLILDSEFLPPSTPVSSSLSSVFIFLPTRHSTSANTSLHLVGKLIFGSTAQESLIELPQGQLYLVRPLSPKGYSELIFKDSAIRIRRTNQDFQYQLVVQRVFEEGEAELLADEEGEDAEIDALVGERDEKTFLLDEALRFRVEIREEGEETVLAWKDLNGDNGDLYEFVCDTVVTPAEVKRFLQTAQECQYERKYRKPHTTASDEDLEQFDFPEEQPIPPASPLHSPTLTRSIDSIDDMFAKRTANSAQRGSAVEQLPEAAVKEVAAPQKAPEPKAAPKPLEIYAAVSGELHLYDPQAGHFSQVEDSVIAAVSEVGNWQYWLQINADDRAILAHPLLPNSTQYLTLSISLSSSTTGQQMEPEDRGLSDSRISQL